MTTDPKMINHLWTHKTQDHPFLSDEELVIDGVLVSSRRPDDLPAFNRGMLDVFGRAHATARAA